MANEDNKKRVYEIYEVFYTHTKPSSLVSRALLSFLISETSYLPEDAKILQRIYHFVNGPSAPICKKCGATVTWRPSKRSYSTYCSSNCAHKDADLNVQIKQTVIERYGVQHISQLREVKHQKVVTLKEKYSVENAFLINKHPSKTVRSTVSTAVAGIDSDAKTQCREWLQELMVEFSEDDKTHNVDFFIPQHSLAINISEIASSGELAGFTRSVWKNTHDQLETKGIHLIQVYDIEWENMCDTVKSRIAHACHKDQTKVFARKCQIRNVTAKEAKAFFNSTHTQKSAQASIAYGLYFNDQLVACMSFSASRYDHSQQYELIRYSTSLFSNVVGGASRLFHHFCSLHPNASIVSYCDMRWGTGNLYKQLGFSLDYVSDPNYKYFQPHTDFKQLQSRQTFQKHKLPHLLSRFDPARTEWENVQEHGYDRIWDCGNGRWVRTTS